jgi:hypothetical protein
MTKTKKFLDWKGFQITADSRDVMLPGHLDYAVYKWCDENKLQDASIFIKLDGQSIWRIPDEKERVWFRLRWDP